MCRLAVRTDIPLNSQPNGKILLLPGIDMIVGWRSKHHEEHQVRSTLVAGWEFNSAFDIPTSFLKPGTENGRRRIVVAAGL